jgi:hypothetical protein
MVTILALIKKAISTFSYSIFTFNSRVKEFVQIKFFRNHRKFKVLKSGSRTDLKKVAVIALFPRGYLLTSTLRLVDSLISNNYQVIAVVNDGNQQYQSWIMELSNRDITILSRSNIGRDFGCYQVGIQYVKTSNYYASIERLVLANDSMYYFPTSRKFLDDLLQDQHAWCAMFVNYQFHMHSQSFFQAFDRSIFTSSQFDMFWNGYYPTNLRHNVINKGEVKLATLLMDGGFCPISYVTPTLIEKSSEFEDFSLEEKFALWNGFSYTCIDQTLNSTENHILKMNRLFIELNPSLHAGMVATRILGAPLKLDFLRTGIVSLSGLVELARLSGLEGRELAEYEMEMASKGSHSSTRGLHRLWRAYGFE